MGESRFRQTRGSTTRADMRHSIFATTVRHCPKHGLPMKRGTLRCARCRALLRKGKTI